MRRLTALTGATEDQIRAAQALIVQCEPKPGRPFSDAESNIIVPDVIVQRAGRGLKVVLNPDVMPKLRINDLYAQAVRGQRNGTGGTMSARLQEARWFMKNIQQRFDTILRVSKAIVERQKSFFTHGAIAMKPLVLREIADELGLHESTISRVTTAKYMATPYGTFELKYFFGSSLNTEAGGNASSTAVRALIQQLVAAESAAKPLSDSQLSQMLEEQGIHVARRTVAKYREALKIAPGLAAEEHLMGTIFVPCAQGVEELLTAEVSAITGQAAEGARGGAWVDGDLQAAMRINLECRLGQRVLWPVADGPYRDEHDLYDLARRVTGPTGSRPSRPCAST
jgi:RNA polymerase sigma-54 factor